MDICERLTQARENKGLSIGQVLVRGWDVGNWETDPQSFGKENNCLVLKVASVYGVSIEWLLLGIGPRLLSKGGTFAFPRTNTK